MVSLFIYCFVLTAGAEIPPDMACVSNGVFHPLFRSLTDLKEVSVKSFSLEVEPVTNEKFLAFVRANPKWQRSQVKRLFADENYLKHWAGDLALGTNAQPQQPVVWVSWFAAKAYAQWAGKRLPTLAEWEVAAAASPTLADGSKDAAFQRDILAGIPPPRRKFCQTSGMARKISGACATCTGWSGNGSPISTPPPSPATRGATPAWIVSCFAVPVRLAQRTWKISPPSCATDFAAVSRQIIPFTISVSVAPKIYEMGDYIFCSRHFGCAFVMRNPTE